MYILYKIFCYGYNNYNFHLTPFVALWVPFVLLGFWWVANGSLQYRKTKFSKPVRLGQKRKRINKKIKVENIFSPKPQSRKTSLTSFLLPYQGGGFPQN